jgi:three-Cys-motif partner protein
MTKTNTFFEKQFEPHTKFKHFVLRAYMFAWGAKLARHSVLWYVDGFAGAGEDSAGSPGSPRIALEVEDHVRKRGQDLQSGARLKCRFFETDPSIAKHLSTIVGQERITLGALSGGIDTLNAEIGDAPALFFIDPFGFSIDSSVVKECLKTEKREVLLLFHDAGAIRHLGTVAAKSIDPDRAAAAVQPNLFEDLERADREAARARQTTRNAVLANQQPETIARLTKVFGDRSWEPLMNALGSEEIRGRLVGLYKDKLVTWGATHVLTIPVRRESDTHVYYLIHASKSEHAYRAMKEAVSTALSRATISVSTSDTIRFQLSSDLGELLKATISHFNGRAAVGIQELREFLLMRTPAFPSDVAQLKLQLRARRKSGRQDIYDFTRV